MLGRTAGAFLFCYGFVLAVLILIIEIMAQNKKQEHIIFLSNENSMDPYYLLGVYQGEARMNPEDKDLKQRFEKLLNVSLDMYDEERLLERGRNVIVGIN